MINHPKNLNIVHFIPQLDTGGSERVMTELALWQMMRGNKVLIVCFSSKKSNENLDENLDIIYYPHPYFSYKLLRKPEHKMNNLIKILDSFHPNIFHSHSYWTDQIIYTLPKIAEKYISHLHLFYPQYKYKFSFDSINIKKWLDKIVLSRQQKKYRTNFVVVSKTAYKYYESVIQKNRLHLIVNSVDLKKFYPSDEEENSNIIYTLLSVGKLSKGKNHHFLLKVAKELKERNVNFKLIIAGEGDLYDKLNKKILDLNLYNYVELKGVINKIESIYRKSKLYLHSSTSETFSLAILEAMASGLPTIALQGDYENVLVENGKQGFLTEKNNIKDFSSKIINLLDNEILYKNMQKQAINTASYYSTDKLGKKIDTLYRTK